MISWGASLGGLQCLMLQLLTCPGLWLRGLFFLGAGQLSGLSNNLKLCIYILSPSAQLIPPDAKCKFVRLGVKYRNSCVCELCIFCHDLWLSFREDISPCKVICVYGTLRRNMACKHVADHHILKGSSIHLQLDMSWFFSTDCKPRAMGQRPANMILFDHPGWCPQGRLAAEGGGTACHEIVILGWWQTKRKDKGKENWVCNHFTGCRRMAGVPGSGQNSVRCSDRPCFIWVPAWKLGYNLAVKKPPNIKKCFFMEMKFTYESTACWKNNGPIMFLS